MKQLKQEMIEITGGQIPITLSLDEDVFVIDVDGVEWLETENETHAIVLFTMMKENITKYYHYEKL